MVPGNGSVLSSQETREPLPRQRPSEHDTIFSPSCAPRVAQLSNTRWVTRFCLDVEQKVWGNEQSISTYIGRGDVSVDLGCGVEYSLCAPRWGSTHPPSTMSQQCTDPLSVLPLNTTLYAGYCGIVRKAEANVTNIFEAISGCAPPCAGVSSFQ